MADENNVYEVIEFSLGEKQDGDKIVFKSLEDLESAYKDIDNGNHIYVSKDGYITKLLHQMISMKVYDGTLRLSARKTKKEGRA